MFPGTSKDHIITTNSKLMLNPSFSPSDRHHINKSTHLPYFKRFPNSKFMSQQRKRGQKFELKQLNTPQQRNSTHQRSSFFRKQKRSFQGRNQSKQQSKAFSSSVLKPRGQSKKKKLIKQFYQKEGSKLRQNTDSAHDYIRVLTNKSSHKRQETQTRLTSLQILKTPNSLQSYEKQEIMGYTQIYYYGQNCKTKHKKLQDYTKTDGSYDWIIGDHINFRYELVQVMGEGSFGEVFKCLDHKKDKVTVALKIVKNHQKYTKQAKTQVKLLNHIKAKDPAGTKNCVHLRQSFLFRSRICMVFDLMSINLYELIKNNGYYGLPLDLIRRMALQILNAMHFLHKNQIIHADLKPENILLKQANKSGVKIIDFGSSCFQKQTIYTYIQSRYYRAPEVILGLQYNHKIDIWSFACIIAELHLGYPLFAGDQQHEQMHLITEVLGLPPAYLSYSAKRWDIFFDNYNNLKPHAKNLEPSSKSLKVALENVDDEDFLDFLLRSLSWAADDRFQALDCLRHNWILKGLPQDIREQHLKFIGQQQSQRYNGHYRKNSSFSIQNRSKLFH